MSTSAAPAVVVGLDTITGLQTARILAGHGVPVIGLTNDLRHYACRTRACVRVLQADLLGEELVDALVRLGPELDERAVLFPCTDLTVLTISRHRDLLAPWYHVALPEHDVVDMLMDKIAFLRHAQERGLRVPGTVILEGRADAERAALTLTYPAVIKPPIKSPSWQAHTSRKAFQVRDAAELLDVYDRVAGWSDIIIAQEWVEGGADRLYSCNAYFDRSSRPVVTFVARKLRQWPPHIGTSSLGEECRNDDVLDETVRLFTGVGYHGLAYLEMKQEAHTGRHFIIEPNIGRPTGRSAIAEGGGVELLYTAYCDILGLPHPAATQQRYVGAKWIDDRRDVQSALYFFHRGEITLGDWLRSVRGPKSHAVVSKADPMPFVHDLLQSTRRTVRLLAARLVRRSAAPAGPVPPTVTTAIGPSSPVAENDHSGA